VYKMCYFHYIGRIIVIGAKQNGAKIILFDPRKNENPRISDMHIGLKNGSNMALFKAMGDVIIEEYLYDLSLIHN
ncbi:hypothetical protein, partial [Enterobacter intestinihominis]